MTPPLLEDITVTINRKSLFTPEIDLRGQRVYFVLQFAHRELTAALEADLSDRWSQFGTPWTGILRTNTFTVDVPAAPAAPPCYDSHSPVPR